jgi:hypothetical protein
MRIGLTGAGGTGKGTLGSLIAKYLGVPFLPSHIKDTGIAMGLTDSYKQEISLERQLAFQHAIMFGQLYQERALNIAGLGYVAERTTLDYIPYFLERSLNGLTYLQTAREWAKTNYDGIIFLPVEFEAKDLVENSWKERDRDAQERTGEIIEQEIMNNSINPVLTVHGSVEERFDQVKNWLDKIVVLKRSA